jgi:hypothetical protein
MVTAQYNKNSTSEKKDKPPCCRLCAALPRYSYKCGIVSRRERKRPVLGRMKTEILSVLFIGKTNFFFSLMIMKVDHGVEKDAG